MTAGVRLLGAGDIRDIAGRLGVRPTKRLGQNFVVEQGTVRQIAALAAATSRVELGPLVASIGFREPTMLAKQAATIDAISGGRFIVGLGAGWNEREYRAYGFAYDHRVSRFEEAFTVIRSPG